MTPLVRICVLFPKRAPAAPTHTQTHTHARTRAPTATRARTHTRTHPLTHAQVHITDGDGGAARTLMDGNLLEYLSAVQPQRIALTAIVPMTYGL